MLAHMTKEWSEISKSIAGFVLALRKNTPDTSYEPINLYNQWVHKYGKVISDPELACWAIEHISNLLSTPLSVLEEAVR